MSRCVQHVRKVTPDSALILPVLSGEHSVFIIVMVSCDDNNTESPSKKQHKYQIFFENMFHSLI